MPSHTATITHQDNCILVKGDLSPSVLKALRSEAPKGSVIDLHVARLANAGMAIGLPDDLAKLRAALEKSAEIPSIENLSPEATKWLALGEQGLSSATMFFIITGVRPRILADRGYALSHPHDPADFNRCLMLIETAPEIGKNLQKMRDVSPAWTVLVDRWDEITQTFKEEAGLNWSKAKSAPKTYTLMMSVLLDAKAA